MNDEQSRENIFWHSDNESSTSPPQNTQTQSSKEEEAVGNNSSVLGLVPKSQTSTRDSLLVEALIKRLVIAYEPDDRKAKRTYRKICKWLFRMGVIDGSWSMAELEGARSQFEHGLLQFIGVAPRTSPSFPPFCPGDDSSSQYNREFIEIELIGRGAFGKVFRVKHKLDDTEYAIKKIPIHSEGLDSVKKYLSEVKTMASINHPNIVQYRAAWLEIGTPHNCGPFPQHDWDKPKITTSSSLPESFILNENISFTRHEAETNFEIAFEKSNRESTNSSSNEEGNTSNAVNAVVLKENNTTGSQECWATLYIQMSLCHGTLHHWLRRRTKSFNPEIALMSNAAQAFKTKAIKEIIIQILKGLAYIHSKGIVHHDIKPGNIFVSAESGSLLVKIGDFGLACPLQRVRHYLVRGTPLYAAPEQLAGRCDPKSDMYSLGIVLFELLEDFNTEMERTKRISELRGRNEPIPKDLELHSLITALVRRVPEERPDAETLLNSLEVSSDVASSQIEALQARVSQQELEIQRLTELLRKNGVKDV